ncbi:MAG: hypothetical protein HY712_02740 [candidate division NC10 bacterium]|nr:hypothetical protein [candidate division NC10 bacterium]
MSPLELPEYTPLFYAQEKGRYFRHEFIRKIEAETGRSLIVYFADVQRPGGTIDRDDIVPFGDLLFFARVPDAEIAHQTGVQPQSIPMLRKRARDRLKSRLAARPEFRDWLEKQASQGGG